MVFEKLEIRLSRSLYQPVKALRGLLWFFSIRSFEDLSVVASITNLSKLCMAYYGFSLYVLLTSKEFPGGRAEYHGSISSSLPTLKSQVALPLEFTDIGNNKQIPF